MQEFRTCLNCGYGRGFHISFHRKDEKIMLIFICPECGTSYDLNLVEEKINELEVTIGMKYEEKDAGHRPI